MKYLEIRGPVNLTRLSGLLIVLPLFFMMAKWPLLPTAPFFMEFFSLKDFFGQTSKMDEILLFIPMGALLTVLIRLTLGIRVLGPFRPLLIATAFQVTGFWLGVFFLILVTSGITFMWPFIKEARLPYFARMAVLLSSVTVFAVGTLIASKWFQIYSLLVVAYLPMIALCLAADGFARALNKEGLHVALWKGGMTIAASLFIYLVYVFADAYEWEDVLSRFPEMLIIQIGLIIFIAENLDFRLFENFNPGSSNDNGPAEP